MRPSRQSTSEPQPLPLSSSSDAGEEQAENALAKIPTAKRNRIVISPPLRTRLDRLQAL